ncbi:MAG: hypothetical protein LBD94_00030 [Rickettsiales bacterium]|nr:hypothetical protein [Rickettsiales bacterium]
MLVKNRVGESRGASILEMLFAIAIVALAMPFAYRQISDVGHNMKMMSVAGKLIADADSIKNYIRLHANEIPPNEVIEAQTDEEDKKIFMMKSSDGIAAYVLINTYNSDILSANKIANLIGPDAGVAEDGGMAYSAAGNWAVSIEGAAAGDIVYRIGPEKLNDDTEKYLHRTVLSEGELSTMKRDLSMGNRSIANADVIAAQKLTSMDLDAYLARALMISANSLYFTNGLNLNPGQSRIPSIRANGDVIGFRNFWTDSFSSPSGAMTTDRASIAKKLTVSKKFEVKSPYSRTVSGFAGVSAGNVKTAYLDTTNLTFMPGFGLTVSSELLYSSTPPIKLGSWTFPNSGGAGPKFNSLKLQNLGNKNLATGIPDFSKILKEGWQ